MNHFAMFFTTSSCFLIIFQTYFTNVIVAANDLDAVCTGLESSFIPKEQCILAFEEDFRSDRATAYDLATIIVDILSTNVMNFEISLSEGVKYKRIDPGTKQILETCLSLYTKGEPMLKQAKDASVAKDYKAATNVLMSYVKDVIGKCDGEIDKNRDAYRFLPRTSKFIAGFGIAAAATEKFMQTYKK